MCPGDELVFTCTVDDIPDAIIAWRRNEMTVIFELNKQSLPFPDFVLNITYYNATERTLTSTATSQSVPVELNGSTISCSIDGTNFNTSNIDIEGIK